EVLRNMTARHLVTTDPSGSFSNEPDATELLAYMDDHVNQIASRTEASEFWVMLTSRDTDPSILKAVLREIVLEVFFYHAPIVHRGMGLIGRMPRTMTPRKVKALLSDPAEEFDHGAMALKDYVALGGDEADARRRRMSPAALAAAGIWGMLLNEREPFAYI